MSKEHIATEESSAEIIPPSSVLHVLWPTLQCREFVTNVASGLINTSRKKKGSRKHVKIIDTEWGILLCVTDGSAHQEIRIYASSVHHAKLSIARGARNANLTISFGRLCP